MYFIVYTCFLEETPPLRGDITLYKPVSREGICASSAWLWSAPNDLRLLKAFLEELAVLFFVLLTNDFLFMI
jgi:hypothetical protein